MISPLSSRQVKYLKNNLTAASSDVAVLVCEQFYCYTNSYCSCLTSYLEHIYLSTPCRRCFAVLTDRYASRFFTLKSNKNCYDSRCESIFFNQATHFALYFLMRLFSAIGYAVGSSDARASFLTSNGVLQLYLSCGRSSLQKCM